MAKKKKKRNWPFVLIFIVGFLILLYPTISRYYYRVGADDNIAQFDEGSKQLSDEEVKRRMALARAFNASLVNNVHDPYSDEEKEAGRAEYARMLEVHEQMGHVEIPKINTDIPIYAGTSEEVLQKGAGHLEGTSLPIGGNSSHTVITAHSGIPTARLFTDLSKLEVGDRFYIHNLNEILAYEVDQIKEVEPSNFEDLLIVPGHDYATLLTCTPIMINTHRLLVRGHRVPYEPLEEQQLMQDNKKAMLYRYAFYLAIALIILLSGLNIRFVKKKKGYEAAYRALKNRDFVSEHNDFLKTDDDSDGKEG
ncbi:MAG: class C sortase [Peptoniphilus sp.]|nr:class C sortase [Peptoniphilus sp.]MDD7363306.1 class C sortase [Bacillota bacterium]MDY6045264.1 class C sortase [Peptoniphilus sp.]